MEETSLTLASKNSFLAMGGGGGGGVVGLGWVGLDWILGIL